MEAYIHKLSECQQSENSIRQERELMLKKHEKELEELDQRMASISVLRTKIIEEFTQFLDSVSGGSSTNGGLSGSVSTLALPSALYSSPSSVSSPSSPNPNQSTLYHPHPSSSTSELCPTRSSSVSKLSNTPTAVPSLLSSSFNSIGTHSSSTTTPKTALRSSVPTTSIHTSAPLQINITSDDSQLTLSPFPKSPSATPSPSYYSASAHSPNPSNVAPSTVEPVPTNVLLNGEPETTMADIKPKPKNRTFKLVQRLKTSKSAGNIPTTVVESPTTTQIESMLSKVRNNVHSLDDSTMNQCIDLLSSRIFKDKDFRIATPDAKKLESTQAPVLTTSGDQQKQPGNSNQRNDKGDSLSVSSEPSSPKKRQETAEERRRRIERVLFEDPLNSKSSSGRHHHHRHHNRHLQKQSQMSRSAVSLNELGHLHHHQHNQDASGKGQTTSGPGQSILRSSASLNRYGNRSSGGKLRRNQSLSPLRFAIAEKKDPHELDDIVMMATEADNESVTSSTSGHNTANHNNSNRLGNNLGVFRRFRSEQQINELADDSISLESSFDVDGDSFDNDNLAERDEDDGEEEEEEEDMDLTRVSKKGDDDDHLLAPSKVAKSQELFTQVFFPADTRQKPLLSKEELSKTRTNNVLKKLSTASHSSEPSQSRTESESPDNSLSASLNVDYLSHLRRNSSSPEQRNRERELNALGNTKKFRCYKDFWEHKTKEILDKKQKYDQWQQTATVNGTGTVVANGPQCQQLRQSISPPPLPAPTANLESPTNAANAAIPHTNIAQVQIALINGATNGHQTNQPNRPGPTTHSIPSKSNVAASINKFSNYQAALQDTNSAIQNSMQSTANYANRHNNKNNGQTSNTAGKHQSQQQQQQQQQQQGTGQNTTTKQNNQPAKQSKSTGKKSSELENDKLMIKLRNIQQDIRQRRSSRQQNSNSHHSNPMSIINSNQPKPVVPKTLDLQYYPLAQQQQQQLQQQKQIGPTSQGLANQPIVIPKSAAIRIVEPNSPEVPTKNRLRLIRSFARDDPDQDGEPTAELAESGPKSVTNQTNGTISNGHSKVAGPNGTHHNNQNHHHNNHHQHNRKPGGASTNGHTHHSQPAIQHQLQVQRKIGQKAFPTLSEQKSKMNHGGGVGGVGGAAVPVKVDSSNIPMRSTYF